MAEYAYHLLHLEQRLESYQRIHREELDEIRRAIAELRNQILFKSYGADSHSIKDYEPSPQMDGDEATTADEG